MYKAALVEDEAPIRAFLCKSLKEQFGERNIPIVFEAFESGPRFLAVFEDHYHYDVIFLDIEMPELDGIEVCRRIRQLAPNALVVFISNKESLVFQTFEVQPFRFVRKSHYQDSLPGLVDALTCKLNSLGQEMIRITEPGSEDVYSFDVNQILYVEAQRKDCRVVTTSGESTIRCALKTIEGLLLSRQFVKTHRSYLVNCRHIYYIGKASLLLTNHKEIPISRSQMEVVRRQFLAYSVE